MSLSKVLKRHSVVIDDTKKFTIPISGMPKEEPELEPEPEFEPGFKTEIEEGTEKIIEPQPMQWEIIPVQKPEPEAEPENTEEQQPKVPRREYDFEDFNFAEEDVIEEQTAIEEKIQRVAEAEAEELIENARNKSEMIISQAVETAQLIITHTLDNAKMELSNAINAGYSDGFEAGRNESLKIVEPALNKINVLAETINRLQDKMLYEFRDSMFNIISEISKKIVHKEVNEDNHYLVGLFSDAIQNIKAEDFVTVTVAESELTVATRNEKLFLAEIPYIKDFKILSDKNAIKGTMIVETEKTVVDASIYVQLEKVDYFLEQMKENLDIPKTVDDIINQVSLRSIEDQAELLYEDEYGYAAPADYNITDDAENLSAEKNSKANSNIKQKSAVENTQNFDDIDISDEEIMKYFDSPDFNVD